MLPRLLVSWLVMSLGLPEKNYFQLLAKSADLNEVSGDPEEKKPSKAFVGFQITDPKRPKPSKPRTDPESLRLQGRLAAEPVGLRLLAQGLLLPKLVPGTGACFLGACSWGL